MEVTAAFHREEVIDVSDRKDEGSRRDKVESLLAVLVSCQLAFSDMEVLSCVVVVVLLVVVVVVVLVIEVILAVEVVALLDALAAFM